MNDDQLNGWLAGLFDGEGSLIVREDRKDFSLDIRAQISNTNFELLETIKDRIGYGFISKVSAGAARWTCTRANVTRFLDRVEPFLIVKREKAAIVRALLATVQVGANQYTKDPRQLLVRERLLQAWELTKTKRDRSVQSVLSETVQE